MKVFLALLLTTSALLGASWDFRGGRILCAELSFAKPAVSGKILQSQKNLPAKPIYAALTILCDDGRRLSVHDYGIEAGSIYPCIAIKKERSPFSADGTGSDMADPGARYTLLFVLDAAYVGLNAEELLTLKALFPPEKYSRQQIPFKNLKNTPLTATEKISLSGLMTEQK
jgi:hypothetical protein